MRRGSFRWLPAWIWPPDLPSADSQLAERARILHVALLASVVIVLIASTFMRFETADLRVGLPVMSVILATCVVGLWALRRGWTRQAGLLYCLTVWGALGTMQLTMGANSVLMAVSFVNLTFIAGFTLGPVVAAVVGLVSALWMGTTLWLEAVGTLPPGSLFARPVDLAVQAGGPLALASILIAYGLARLNAAVRTARASQAESLARAREGAVLGDLGQRVVQSLDPASFSEVVAQAIQSTLGVEAVAIYQARGDHLGLVYHTSGVDVPERLDPKMDPIATCLESDAQSPPARLERPSFDQLLPGLPDPIQFGAAVPVPGRAGRAGCILVLDREPEALKPPQLAFLRTCATLLGAAVDRNETDVRLRQAQRMEAVGQLAGGIAHDFNNLLSGILGFAELATEDLGPSHPVAPMLRDISRSSEHAALLTRQLLTFSRKKALRLKVVDVCEVVTGLQGILDRLMGDPIAMEVSVGDEPALVFADANALEQILFNLCLNARDAIERQGTIAITVETIAGHADPDAEPEDRVRLIVEDDGCGMDAETVQHIFEPFFTTKDPERGTGLGLATVQGLVKELGGGIEVDSEVGRGTRFLVEFAGAPQKAQEADAAGTAAPRGRGELIMVVEDHVLARRSLEQTLIRNGYQLVTARDGAEALDILAYRDDVGAILSDITMPRMNGDQLLEELRRRDCDTPVVFLSGFPQAAGRLALEDVPVLAKPVATDLLLRTLRAALDGRQTKQS